METYTEIKIFPCQDYGYSVEDYNMDIGDDGITISSFDYGKKGKENIQYLCMNREVAEQVAHAILKILNKE